MLLVALCVPILPLATIACGGSSGSSPDGSSPVGTWVTDLDAMKAKASGPESNQAMMDMVWASIADSEWILRGDGSYEAMLGSFDNRSRPRGTWELHGDKLTLSQTFLDGVPNPRSETWVFSGDQIRTAGATAAPYVMKRQPTDS